MLSYVRQVLVRRWVLSVSVNGLWFFRFSLEVTRGSFRFALLFTRGPSRLSVVLSPLVSVWTVVVAGHLRSRV
jgi:hypothetical protein